MEVKWSTLQVIAQTKSIDVWFLFPAMAVNRLLFKNGKIPKSMEKKLDTVFGSNSWRHSLYQETQQLDLFNKNKEIEKIATFEEIKGFYLNRLRTIFSGVADNPLPLKNSKGSILFYLCFAVGNPSQSAKSIALKIAQHILAQR